MSDEDGFRGRELWWRHTARRPRLMGLDAGVLAPLAFVLVHPRVWTLWLALGVVALLVVLWFLRVTPTAAMRGCLVVMRTAGLRRGLVARDRRGQIWR